MKWKTRSLIALAGAAAGFYAARAIRGKRVALFPFGRGIKIRKEATIGATPEQLYSYWRTLTNIPPLLDHALEVKILDDKRSHWTLTTPRGHVYQWDAEITVDRKNEMIGWRSLDGADIDSAGYIRFEPAAGGGTVVRVALQYNPPGGKLGAAVADWSGAKPAGRIEAALERLKRLMESETSPARSKEPVEVASEDSFPASDAPSWTGTTGP